MFYSACFSFIFVVSQVLAAGDGPEVQTVHGLVRGQYTTTRSGRKVVEFLGVRYAQPPLNSLKFLSPKEPVSWDGVKDTIKECDACLQQLTLIEAVKSLVSGSEDCLCMNIFTPDPSASTKMPVILWIHGGAHEGLSSAKACYGPEMLLDKDVVLITFNYRLGVMGFLTTEDEVLPGNLAMKDQAAALRYVKANIDKFGGDINSITLMGESSGAGSVHLHMLSPLTHKLFHRGIALSGSSLCQWGVAKPGVLKERSRFVAQLIGCPFTPSKDFLACLQKSPSATIVNTTQQFLVWDIDPVAFWNPVIEKATVLDAFLTKSAWHLTSTKPLLTGYNYAEGGMKLCSITSGDVTGKFKQWNAEFNRITPISLLYNLTAPDKDDVTKKVREFYLGGANNPVTPQMTYGLNQMYGDFWFINGVLDAVEKHKGEKYLYHFNYNTTYSVCSKLYNNNLYVGACHLDELMCFFNMNMSAANFYKSDQLDYKVSTKLVELWTNFAKNSVPTASGVTWNPVTTSALEHLEISNNGYSMKTNPIGTRRTFWKSLAIRATDSDNSVEVVD